MSTITERDPLGVTRDKPSSPIRHIYIGHEYMQSPPTPIGARAYCGHIKTTSGWRRDIGNGPRPDTCVVCWELAP